MPTRALLSLVVLLPLVARAAEPTAPAARILDLLHWEVRRFTGLSNRADDETLVVLRVRE